MIRYSIVKKKNKREIVLLKGFPCKWGKCSYCDYILDNSTETQSIVSLNRNILNNVTGKYGALEIVNSGSIFELPQDTLNDIKNLINSKNIKKIFVESHWIYRNKLQEIKDFFCVNDVLFQFGIETFDNAFRNSILRKGTGNLDAKCVSKYFNAVYLLVGIKGQTKEMIQEDIQQLLEYFSFGKINIFIKNSTPIQPDPLLIEWFHKEYSNLESLYNVEIMWNNTDLGIG